jgi:uncharacterized protein (TIGR00299 family) protein
MKILYYDCFSGISGDMNLGAMIDLGVDPEFLRIELGKLNLPNWKLEVVDDQRHGITGTRVSVIQTKEEHVHRHLSDIEKIIKKSSLGAEVKATSMKIFMKIAEAEAKVHGIAPEEVHFHEVGAIDSIIDIAGAAICYHFLNPDAVIVSPLELGSGMVRCDHGLLPVPAPATAEIVSDIPVKTGGVGFEATTPTGAAIVTALGTKFTSQLQMKIIKTGHGIGQKDNPSVPNILRVFLGENDEKAGTGHEAILLECNIDDMNPEFYDHISERLFAGGASDVFLTNIIMKKGRPGIILSVICESGSEGNLKEIIFTESTTIGIRTIRFGKDTLLREFRDISTRFGKVTFKNSYFMGKLVSSKPESDHCRRIARETGMPVREIYNILISEIQNQDLEKK